jgi:hypothetical protein
MGIKKQKGIVFSKVQYLADKFWPVVLLGAIIFTPFVVYRGYREMKQAEENNKR